MYSVNGNWGQYDCNLKLVITLAGDICDLLNGSGANGSMDKDAKGILFKGYS